MWGLITWMMKCVCVGGGGGGGGGVNKGHFYARLTILCQIALVPLEPPMLRMSALTLARLFG